MQANIKRKIQRNIGPAIILILLVATITGCLTSEPGTPDKTTQRDISNNMLAIISKPFNLINFAKKLHPEMLTKSNLKGVKKNRTLPCKLSGTTDIAIQKAKNEYLMFSSFHQCKNSPAITLDGNATVTKGPRGWTVHFDYLKLQKK